MKLKVHIQPGAKKDEVMGLYGDAVKIRLRARPIEGKANDALIKFLSEALCVSRSDIEIVSGETSRQKMVSINCPEGAISKLIGGKT